MFSCGKCVRDFYKINLYLLHIKHVHSHEPYFHYICGYNGCPITTRSYSAFRSHLLRHNDLSHKNNVKMICEQCGFKSYLKSKFIYHFKAHNVKICPIQNCKLAYDVYSSFSSHLSRCHPCFKATETKSSISLHSLDENVARPSIDNRNSTDDLFSAIQIPNEIPGGLDDLKRNISLFIIKMQEKFLLPASVVGELVMGMSQLQEESIVLFKNNILNALKELKNDTTLYKAIQSEQSCNALSSTFTMLNSVHLKTNYMIKTLGLIEPVQYKLGSINGKEVTFQYIPILNNLQAFIKNNEVLDFIMNYQSSKHSAFYEDIHDGTTFKANKVFSDFPNIQIILYFDEFGVTNPLRGNQSKHKLGVFYYTLGNLPVHFRSCVDDIQLALIFKSFYLKQFGLSQILAPLIKDLKILETEGIKIEGIPSKVKGSVAFIVSDNLGAHQIGGYSTNFKSTSVTCRFCLASTFEMQNVFKDNAFVRRNKDTHNRQISMIQMHPTYSSVYGLKFDCPFNALFHFHSSLMLPPDPMHDLLEGIVPMELKLIISGLISSNFFRLQELNSKILSFKFCENDYVNKPSVLPINYEKGFKLNASRMWCFLRLLPIIIGDKIPEDEPLWALLLILKEIVDVILSPVINLTYISYLSDLITDHHNLLKSLFPDICLKPKHHFLVHYPKLITEFGPLISCWSMRFESKHLYFKRIAQSIKNSINLPFSLAKRHQQLQCYYNCTSSRRIGKFHKLTNAKPLNKSIYSEDVRQQLEMYSDFYVVSKAEISGISYKPGMCVVQKFQNDEPVFSRIIVIISRNEEIRFVCRTYTSQTYFHIGGYKIIKEKNIHVLSFNDLIDKYPLPVYQYKTEFVVIAKYSILSFASEN